MFFQDGCGVYAREPYVARSYLDELVSKLGATRAGDRRGIPARRAGGFRAASADELSKQLVAYRGYSVYLFDGPHYVSDDLTRALSTWKPPPPRAGAGALIRPGPGHKLGGQGERAAKRKQSGGLAFRRQHVRKALGRNVGGPRVLLRPPAPHVMTKPQDLVHRYRLPRP